MASFGNNLKRIRTEKKISQGELASLVNMHATHISRYERDVTTPSIDVLKKIAEQLDITTDNLLYGTDEEKAKNKITDNELLSMFNKVQLLENSDVDCVKSLLSAYIFKKDMQQQLA